MSWVNWADIDKFGKIVGLSEREARERNRDPLMVAGREEFETEFDIYREPLEIILYSKEPRDVGRALVQVPSDVLKAFFGVAGPGVVAVKVNLSGGIKV